MKLARAPTKEAGFSCYFPSPQAERGLGGEVGDDLTTP